MAFSIDNLVHAYGNSRVLNGLTTRIREGEFFIIIGPNGSGKTTLLKLLCGITPLQQGAVRLFGQDLPHYSRRRLARALALVPQQLPPDFPFTVLQTAMMGRFPHLGMLGVEGGRDVAIARRSLSFCGVAHLAERKMTQLSGGERQRVFISKALCQEPRVLLLDEPTAALDLSHQVRIMDLLEQLKREQGVTVIMVSHDVNLAALYADRLMLMKDGRIVREGTPVEVLTYAVLEEVYGCTILVDESPLGRAPRITPVPRRYAKAPR